MSSNGRAIDYRLRVAKSVERRMLCSAFQKLSVFYPLNNYRYIGFGAYYFSDFYLYHKELGIGDMLSIEKARTNDIQDRYNFNRPFSCIDIDFRESKVVLPQLKWDKPVIIWLDYTDVLNSEILSDIDSVIRNAISGSVLVITLKADSESFTPSDSHPESFNKLDILRENIGAMRVPRRIKKSQISNKGITEVFRQILDSETKNILFERNQGDANTNFVFNQLFNFKYKDETPMYSYGGIIIDEKKHKSSYESIGFEKLNFIETKADIFDIKVPNLTLKEIKFLESIMPNGIDGMGNIVVLPHMYHKDPKIPPKDILNFSKIYQYFPTFTEAKIG